MEIAEVTKEGYRRTKALGEGPREVVRLREGSVRDHARFGILLTCFRDLKPPTPPKLGLAVRRKLVDLPSSAVLVSKLSDRAAGATR